MRIILLITLFLLTSCGGRPLNLVDEENVFDDQLTCSHIMGEFEMNVEKISDISKERSKENGNNIGLLLVAPLFLDFSDTEKKEIEALQKRNKRLESLALNKQCKLNAAANKVK